MELLFQRIENLLSKETEIHKPTPRIFDTSINENGEIGGIYALPNYSKLTIHKEVSLLEMYGATDVLSVNQSNFLTLKFYHGPVLLLNQWSLEVIKQTPSVEPFPFFNRTKSFIPWDKQLVPLGFTNIYTGIKQLDTNDGLFLGCTRLIDHNIFLIRNGECTVAFKPPKSYIRFFVVRGDGAVIVICHDGTLYLLK